MHYLSNPAFHFGISAKDHHGNMRFYRKVLTKPDLSTLISPHYSVLSIFLNIDCALIISQHSYSFKCSIRFNLTKMKIL